MPFYRIDREGRCVLFHGIEAFNHHYISWTGDAGLADKQEAFITGSVNLITGTGRPHALVVTLMGVFVASFAATTTTMDTARRLQRYVISELAGSWGIPSFGKKHPAIWIAVSTALILAFTTGESGTGEVALWPLFGAVNQLPGGLTLMVITVWLANKNIPIIFTAIPMVFMTVMTGWAMAYNLRNFKMQGKWLLLRIGIVIIFLELWMVVEGIIVLARLRRKA